MKGVVFVALSEMIQEMYGHRAWNDFIKESKVESEGVYTSTEIYDDKESKQLLSVISAALGKKESDILYIFGLYLIKYFQTKYPESFRHDRFVDFMSSIGTTVHVEIEKLSPNCTPPLIKVLDVESNKFTVYYFSKRKLCRLAHGLMSGAAKIYKADVEINHISCRQEGDDQCLFEIKYK